MLARKRLLGEYSMGKTIGQGAFSKVKIANHRETSERVAIKVIDKKLMEEKARKSKEVHDERERKRQADEARRKATEKEIGKNSKGSDSPLKSSPTQGGTQSIPRALTPSKDLNHSGNSGRQTPVQSFVSKLQKEVQLMMRLDHPNIVRIYQVLETEEECFIVMEYAKGGELIEYIAARDHLNEKEARKFFRQIISALDHCHMANVVHRDLKLENILLSEERNVLLSDFGLGRTFDPDSGEYMKTFCGTPNYAAVELISGIPYVGVKSDIWAMGVVLYIMMTGRPPFIGDSISELYKKIKSVNYAIPSYFSRDLVDLFRKILVKDPVARIDMDGLRNHPWVTYEYIQPPLRIQPKITGVVDATALSQVISGIYFDKTFVVYVFHKHSKKPRSTSIDNGTPNQQEKDSAYQHLQPHVAGFGAVGAKGSLVGRPRRLSAAAAEQRLETIQRKSISFADHASHDNIQTTRSSSLSASSSLRLEDRPKANTNGSVVNSQQHISQQSKELSSNAESSLLNDNKPGKRMLDTSSAVATSTLTQPIRNTRRGRSYSFQDSRIQRPQIVLPPTTSFPPDESSACSSQEDNRLPDAQSTHLSFSSTRNSTMLMQTNDEVDTGGSRSRSHSISRRPSFLNQLLGQTSNDANHNESFTEKEQKNTILPSRKSRDASGKVRPQVPNLVAPNDRESMILRRMSMVSPVLSDVSVLDRLEFKNTSTNGHTRNESDVGSITSPVLDSFAGRRATQSPQQSPDSSLNVTKLGNTTLTASDPVTGISSIETDGVGITYKEVESWHVTHKPPKEIRTMRFPFNSKTTSSTLEPSSMFQDVHQILIALSRLDHHQLIFSRVPDYYMFHCEVRDAGQVGDPSNSNRHAVFELEICKVWLLKMHGLRIKRVAGNPFLFKDIYSLICHQLKWS